MIYIQINKDNYVIGYSSSKIFENDIEVKAEDLEKRFFDSPFFYVYKEISEKIEYSEDLYNAYLAKKNNKPKKPEDILLKQMADIKVDAMKKDTIINNLVSQIAAAKVENMKLKGSN